MKQATVKIPSGTYTIAESDKNGVVIFGTSMIGWQLLGVDPTALTEEEAGEIVETIITKVEMRPMGRYGWHTRFKDYQSDDWVLTPTVSLDSLAASLGISKPYVILKLKTKNNGV